MALAYTIAGLRAELDALETARKARDWGTAWDEFDDYASVYAGLSAKAKTVSQEINLPDPGVLEKILANSQARISRTEGRPRFLFTRNNFRRGDRVPRGDRVAERC